MPNEQDLLEAGSWCQMNKTFWRLEADAKWTRPSEGWKLMPNEQDLLEAGSWCQMNSIKTQNASSTELYLNSNSRDNRVASLGHNPVSRQSTCSWVITSHNPSGDCHYFLSLSANYLPSHRSSPSMVGTKLYCLVTQACMCVWRTCSGSLRDNATAGSWTCDLLIASPTL